MNIEIFELEYLKFILSNVWNFICFIIILLIITNSMRKIFTPVGNFLKRVKLRYKKLGDSAIRTGEIYDKIKPDILKEEKEE